MGELGQNEMTPSNIGMTAHHRLFQGTFSMMCSFQFSRRCRTRNTKTVSSFSAMA